MAYLDAVVLDPDQTALIEGQCEIPEAIAALGWMLCYPNDTTLVGRLALEPIAGETLEEHAERVDLSWSPRWLLDAGFSAIDANGTAIQGPVTNAGPIQWEPHPRPARVDDQTSDGAAEARLEKRFAGEVALVAMWAAAAARCGLDDRRELDMKGGTRGARFKDFLVTFLRARLPETWTVEPEVKLTRIRGLHMRKTVGDRRSDIVVIDSERRLVAVISSKWTWRSDRGTEAAQMVPLMRYRPDVPYAVVTAEFPRARVISTESIEDRAYHLCPEWVGTWQAIYALPADQCPRTEWPDLASLEAEGRRQAGLLNLHGLDDLANDLLSSGDIL